MSDEIPEFDKLKEIPMREIRAHEAHEFTPWLKNNISALGKALNLDLRVTESA